MTTAVEPDIDPTHPDHKFTWFDPSRLSRGQLMKAAKLREMPIDVSHSNIDLINSLNQWMDANGVRRPAVEVEAEDETGEDDGPDFDLDAETLSQAPATGATSASAPVAGTATGAPTIQGDSVTISRTEWDSMQAAIARLLAGQQGAVAKPLDEATAAPVGINAAPQKTGVFPGGYRAEHIIGHRGIDDTLHFQLLESTHNEAVAAGYRTKGAPLAGLRIGYSKDDRGVPTAIYEVSIFRE